MDPLHPLATLQWECCHLWTDPVVPTRCEVLNDTVVILSQGKLECCDSLYVTTCSNLCSWSSITLPKQSMSFTTYQSRFVAVGGRHPCSYEVTNKLWTSSDGLSWQSSLPPMPTGRCHASCVSGTCPEEFLVVAGGQRTGSIYADTVEVLFRDAWCSVNALPSPCWNVRSILHDGNLYFMGGWGQGFYAYTCSSAQLVLSCEKVSTSTELWQKFKVPGERVTPGSFQSRLICIDQHCIVRAYDTIRQVWVETTNTKLRTDKYTPFVATTILPSGEFTVVHRYYGFNKIKLLSKNIHVMLKKGFQSREQGLDMGYHEVLSGYCLHYEFIYLHIISLVN